MISINPNQHTIPDYKNLFRVKISDLGLQDYQSTWQSMVQFTEQRSNTSHDQIWLVEHPPVYTMGLAAKKEHILHSGNIPIVNTDRGGQITYHGPGQIVVYLLIDLKRRNIGIKTLVQTIELSLIKLLNDYSITAHTIDKAPGVYVKNSKIAALGLRVRRNGCYHGLSLNIDMDMTPFSGINPCGYPGLKVIQLKDLKPTISTNNIKDIQHKLLKHLLTQIDEKTKATNDHE